ncbi:hypothetical protein [Roseovarius sp. Pro17]|uniref:hypothetical protein n=1 Tax=Roseovarius sp. Pro17 TaxID=3108175 RepID=UPI002D7A19D8|nr:hypothetical protein [Roseovarius sp. Pro17]
MIVRSNSCAGFPTSSPATLAAVQRRAQPITIGGAALQGLESRAALFLDCPPVLPLFIPKHEARQCALHRKIPVCLIFALTLIAASIAQLAEASRWGQHARRA